MKFTIGRSKRHIIKTLTYKSIAFSVLFLLCKIFGLPLKTSVAIAITDTLLSSVIYFILEEKWDATRCIKRFLRNRTKRHVMKAFTYRVISIFQIIAILSVFGASSLEIGGITAIFETVSTLQYFLFEELWDESRKRLRLW